MSDRPSEASGRAADGGHALPGRQSRPVPGRRSRPVLGRRSRLEAYQRVITRHPLVLAGLDIQHAYERGGGAMLSAGLSFFAFFTVVPALLLFTSILGLLVSDAAVRAELVDALVGQVEPLADVARAVVDGLADSAATGTVLGLLGLLWGASGFYGALQGSMQRMFPGPATRDFVSTRIRGVLAVALILASMLVAVLVVIIVPPLTNWLDVDLGAVSVALAPLLACAVAALACAVVYVTVPPDGPSLRLAAAPALLAGVAIGSLTSLFGVVTPFLVRNFLALGVVGSVFIALVWFNLVFQLMLYGAALARLHRDRDRMRTSAPTL